MQVNVHHWQYQRLPQLNAMATFSITCQTDALLSDACPNGHIPASWIDIAPSIADINFSTLANSFNYTFGGSLAKDVVLCDDYQECASTAVTNTVIAITGEEENCILC